MRFGSASPLEVRMGFEPTLGYKPKHAFQACALNHSATSPYRLIYRSLIRTIRRVISDKTGDIAYPALHATFFRVALQRRFTKGALHRLRLPVSRKGRERDLCRIS